jgi:hypothetical protein
MGYQGNKGNLPEKEEQTESNAHNRSSNADDLRSNNTEQNQLVADDSSSEDTGTRDTETDTLGNP